MEEAFETEICLLKEKYETLISVGEQLSDSNKNSTVFTSPRSARKSDTDSDSYVTPRDGEPDAYVDSVQQEPKVVLQDLLRQVEELKAELNEKDVVIGRLEAEKMESEKLYRDLLEKEESSPRRWAQSSPQKSSHLSSSSLDTSFHSAQADINGTPRSFLSDSTPRSVLGDDRSPGRGSDDSESPLEDIAEMSATDSLPFANDSSDMHDENLNNNNNNNNNSDNTDNCENSNNNSVNVAAGVEELQSRVSELEKELRVAHQRMEEKEHKHAQLMEVWSCVMCVSCIMCHVCVSYNMFLKQGQTHLCHVCMTAD